MSAGLENFQGIRRRTFLAGTGGLALAAMTNGGARAADEVGGELAVLNWAGGTELEMLHNLQKAFVAKYPKVKIREVNVTGQGDMRPGMRTALMGGEKVDLFVNTWPAFRKELADAGILRPIDDQWKTFNWDKRLDASWRKLGSLADVTYGLTYTFGDRSGIWYKKDHMAKAGIAEMPKTWDEFTAALPKLQKAGFAAPIAIPGKYWAHAEWFETLLLRTAGVEASSKLAAHQIPWTDAIVKTALKKYASLISGGFCGAPADMLSTEWDAACDQVFQANAKNFVLIGMWLNARAKDDYKLVEGKDYSLFQFPALGMGHDDTSSVDSKEFVVTANGANPKAADAFLDFCTTADAANIIAKAGLASPSKEVDASLYGDAQKIATAAVAKSKVQFVLGDLLPGDLVDEYRVQLQKFLQDPSDANIDKVLAAIEAKAKASY
ncbi:multiple sugar transport system substrate-binding protein [Rhizobium aquaticum]|uniref:Multiple sugar transport system substrate-binding protein n=1 Tax=Rhizobium aquaticum TaxID=1549636 RepID=A0ABV2J508_9HYPH